MEESALFSGIADSTSPKNGIGASPGEIISIHICFARAPFAEHLERYACFAQCRTHSSVAQAHTLTGRQHHRSGDVRNLSLIASGVARWCIGSARPHPAGGPGCELRSVCNGSSSRSYRTLSPASSVTAWADDQRVLGIDCGLHVVGWGIGPGHRREKRRCPRSRKGIFSSIQANRKSFVTDSSLRPFHLWKQLCRKCGAIDAAGDIPHVC